MGNIPITTQQVGPGLGTTSLPLQRTGGMAGRTLDAVATEAEAYLTRIAEQDAAVEGLNKLADFKAAQSKRLQDLQASVKTPDGFTPMALQDFDKASQEFLKTIDNPRTASFIQSRLPDVRANVAGSAVSFEASTRQALRAENFSQSVNKLSTMAQMNLQAYDSARADVVALLDAGGFEPADAAKLQGTALAALARSAVFGELERNPQAMLDRLNKGDFGDLDADVRLQAVNAAQNEIKRREAQAKADMQLARQEALVTVSDWARDDVQSRAETGKGVPPPPGVDVAAVLNPVEAAKVARRQEQADRLFKATADLPTQDAAQMVATVEALKPQAGQDNYAEQSDIYNSARKKMDDIISARAADPAAYTRQTFPAVQQAWQKFETDQTPQNLQAALRANWNAQGSVGIPPVARKPMSVQQAKSYAQLLTGAKPEDAYRTMRGLASDFGPWWPAALSQMGPMLPSNYKVAASIDNPVDASRLIQASRQSLDSLRRAAGDSATTIGQKVRVNENIRTLAQSFGLGGPRLAADVSNAAETLALALAIEGVSDPVGQAVKAIVTDRYEFGYVNNKPFAVVGAKYRGRVGEIEEGASVALNNIDAARLSLPALDPAVDRNAQAASYLSAVKRNGYWANYEGGGGIMLMSERNVPVLVDGKPLRLTWDDLLKMNREAPRREPLVSYRTGKIGMPESALPRKTATPAAAPRPQVAPAPTSTAPTLRGPTAPAPAMPAAGDPGVISEADFIAQGMAQAERDANRPLTEGERRRIRQELQDLGRKRRPQGPKPDGK